MPTRLPYGLSFIKPHLAGANTAAYTFTAGDTTPDVSLGTVFYCSRSGSTITNFDNGELGKIIIVHDEFGGTTIGTGGNITLARSFSANTATGAITYSAAGTYAMGSNSTAFFLFKDSINCVQINQVV